MKTRAGPVSVRRVLFATATPMASIFGSGFLIIVPVLERTLGAWAVFGALAVCALAWVIGTAVRHCVRVVEPLAASGELDRTTASLDRWGDAVIVVAYVISVALYLRIMAEYLVGLVVPEGDLRWEKAVACAAVVVISIVGIRRGFQGLEFLERAALAVVFVLTFALGVALLVHDAREHFGPGLTLPPVPDVAPVTTLLVLGGIVITVQGFETIRYLGDDYDAETRIWASRIAQIVATIVYVLFVAVATPVMGIGTSDGYDNTLLDITRRVAPLLTIPLVISAVLSQFSAATADTAAADGNMRGLWTWMRGSRPYVIGGAAAILLAATVETFWIIAVASRAFAAYYALQAIIALRTSPSLGRKLGYGALSALMVAITVLAEPAG
ncbi:MAG: hypothetical protein ABI720_01090 [Actinomycetes bacterium]